MIKGVRDCDAYVRSCLSINPHNDCIQDRIWQFGSTFEIYSHFFDSISNPSDAIETVQERWNILSRSVAIIDIGMRCKHLWVCVPIFDVASSIQADWIPVKHRILRPRPWQRATGIMLCASDLQVGFHWFIECVMNWSEADQTSHSCDSEWPTLFEMVIMVWSRASQFTIHPM